MTFLSPWKSCHFLMPTQLLYSAIFLVFCSIWLFKESNNLVVFFLDY